MLAVKMEKLDLQNRLERVPEFLRPNQVGPDGSRTKPSDGEIACNLVFALVVKGIAIAMVVIGAQNLENCPAEPMVPKYLIGRDLYDL